MSDDDLYKYTRGKYARQREQAQRKQAQRKQVSSRKPERFSEASKDGTCPNCGGTSFKAKRSIRGKLLGATIGLPVAPIGSVVGAAAAPKTQVRCVTCGTIYRRS